MNIDQQIAARQGAIERLQERANELQDQYDSVLAQIPCDRQDEAAQKMSGISAQISKATSAISKLKEQIRILTCIKNNQSREKAKSCVEGEKEEGKGGKAASGKGGKSGKGGPQGQNASERTKTKGRLSELEKCMGKSGTRGNRGAGK